MEPAGLYLRNAEVFGHGYADVLVHDGVISRIGSSLPKCDEQMLDCQGGALLPGLHDHHCHLLAAAATAESVPCGPPVVIDRTALERQLRNAIPVRGWIRGVAYDESVAGDLDAEGLDRISPDVPTRVQHRSGALWVVNSPGMRALGLTESEVDGLERDAAGRPTGRLWRLDEWLRARLGPAPMPDLGALSARFSTQGVTGVTDATPDISPDVVDALSAGMSQRLMLLGADSCAPGVALGPRKLILSDHDLPNLDDLVERIRSIRPRPVAVHSVTRTSLVLLLAALTEIGSIPGDRIEHAAVAPPETMSWMAELGITVVTQPSLVARRGDTYLDRVDQEDLHCLWPFRSFLDAGIPVACSSDAPYGDLDPWSSIAAAVERRSPSGRPVTAAERVDAGTALRGFLTAPDDLGGPPRAIAVGEPADLVALDRPLASALALPRAVTVILTIIAGRVVHSRLG